MKTSESKGYGTGKKRKADYHENYKGLRNNTKGEKRGDPTSPPGPSGISSTLRYKGQNLLAGDAVQKKGGRQLIVGKIGTPTRANLYEHRSPQGNRLGGGRVSHLSEVEKNFETGSLSRQVSNVLRRIDPTKVREKWQKGCV